MLCSTQRKGVRFCLKDKGLALGHEFNELVTFVDVNG